MKYRSEIDGLRAVAVVPVILFHAGFGAFSGGYVGVDVFFVISGYLITMILLAEIEAGTFSIGRFYERRARRILPALFVVMAACVPFALLWMIPDQLRDFGRSVTAVVFFVSNFLFWSEEGSYFAAAAELKPLLHTWSLAVEEQYYLIAPLSLALLWRFGRRTVFWLVVATAVVSLAATEWGWRFAPRANFYLPQFRIWELLAGSICGFLAASHARPNNVLSALGLAMIVFAIFAFDAATPFPSLYALVPVGGAALIVMYAHKGTFVARVLSARALVGIGLISYSAYLWHQPLFAFARIRALAEPAPALMMGLAALSLGLAYLSWRFVEQPFRRGRPLLPTRRAVFAASAVAGAVFAGFGAYASVSGGIPSRLAGIEPGSYGATLLASVRHNRLLGDCYDGIDMLDAAGRARLCPAFDPPDPELRILVIGDSHSGTLLPAFAGVGQRNAVYRLGIGGCPPIRHAEVRTGILAPGACPGMTQAQMEAVRDGHFDVVVLVARWSLYTQQGGRYYILAPEAGRPYAPPRETFETLLPATVAEYRALGAAVVVIDQVPEQNVPLRALVEQAALLASDGGLDATRFEQAVREVSVTVEENTRRQGYSESVLDRLRGDKVWVLSFDELFAHDGRYLAGDRNGAFYGDTDHLTAYGAAMLAPAMTAAFDEISRSLRTP
ncbi:acyltransferase family protein [Ancylobacter sp.]|uniref:acyltransferase family protein n=1 Tax=Ancylobacter sp. TaxID=1872567 RepID=UPI003D0E5516